MASVILLKKKRKENMEIDDFTYLNTEILENLTIDDGKYIQISKGIAEDIKTKKLTVLEAVQKLGCLLTNQSSPKRELGVVILSETLQNLDLEIESSALNPEHLLVLSSYFSEKLKDNRPVAVSALKGIFALLNSSNISSDSVVLLVTSIFNHITCQQQEQKDRYLVFQIYERILTKHIKEVHLMGIDFVYGVISSIDGERDPKNLIYLFNWLQIFFKTVKLGHLTEEMFEVLAMYFPVDFVAPPGDKNKIARIDLATGLCQCLTSIADFGPHSIPLALEKLDSALKIAKEDSLDILRCGCENYDPSIYLDHSVEIWSQIQKEIFNTPDENLKQKSLDTLGTIIKKLSQGDSKRFEAIINDISDNLKGNLIPDSKLFTKSSQILVYVAHASEKSSIIVAKKIVPFLENTFKITTNTEHKSLILHHFVAFVKAVIDNNNNIDLSSFEEIGSAPILCSQATLQIDDNLRMEGFKGFTEIARFVPDHIRRQFFANLHELIVIPQKEAIRKSIFTCLEKMCVVFPKEIEEEVLHKGKVADLDALDMYLECLTNVLKVAYFQDSVIDTLINYTLDDVDSSKVALKHLKNILTKESNVDRILVKKNFFFKLIDFLVNLDDSRNLEHVFFNNIGCIIQYIIRNQDIIVQKEFYLCVSVRDFKCLPLYISAVGAVIISMKKGVFDDHEKTFFFLNASLSNSDEYVRNYSLGILSNILNKIDNEEILAEHLNKIWGLSDNCTVSLRKIRLISRVTKSLVMRNHPNAWNWTDKLINALDENIETAKEFKVVLDDNNVELSKENHCRIMPLYKQKFFVYVTNKLNEKNQINRPEYFTVAGYLLENAPRQAVLAQFKKILGLILMCLENSTESEALQSILEKINDFVASKELVIEANFEDIFLRVLNLTSFNSSMGIRISAIKCIKNITMSYPVYRLLPYKQKVIQQLGICVDDKKRLVRREAMDCRALWYLLDAPE